MTRIKLSILFVLICLLGSGLFLAPRVWTQVEELREIFQRPIQRQSPARVHEISGLDIQRIGVIKLNVLNQDEENVTGQKTRLSYSLHAPTTAVEDTDIRGFLDGSTKYAFNQATSYHMRVGRRYGGSFRGEHELKRSLIRWSLPQLPQGARIVSARVTFWVEQHLDNSPLAKSDPTVPLHLYLYPLTSDWSPGQGGINKDSFSDAAPGEASWTAARLGETEWPAPGALGINAENSDRRYLDDPLAVAMIQDDNALTLDSARLAAYLQQAVDQQGTLDLLLKLDDQAEDRWGTETAIVTSNFGDDKDIVSRRPRLDFVVEFDRPSVTIEQEFVLESGMDFLLPVLEHPGQSIILSASIVSDHDEIPPEIWIRGGSTGENTQSGWIPYSHPVEIDWDWTEIRLSAAHNRLYWGEQFTVNLLETWVTPGPRKEQVPEMVLVAPSGKIHRVDGQAVSDLSYQLAFQPNELGLWKYGWSFRPMSESPPGSHQGEGLFFVDLPLDGSSEQALEAYATYLIASLRVSGSTSPMQVNTFVRRASEFAQRGSRERQISERLIEEVRQTVDEERAARANRSRVTRFVQKVENALLPESLTGYYR